MSGHREAVRHFNTIVGSQGEPMLDAAPETLIDPNDVAHKYELYEAVSQKTLRNYISYASDYKRICKALYDYCRIHDMVSKES